MVDKQNPLVSIHCLTYNHARYIAKALDSLLMQKTKFRFEIIVHDDASTDGTDKIIDDYARRYPDMIKPIFEKTNQFSKHANLFIKDMFMVSQGKYITQCEGDDYWTDPQKLQKQVDWMDKHTEYALCFHPVEVIFEDKKTQPFIYPSSDLNKSNFTAEELLRQNYIQSNSVMFRKLKKSNYKNVVAGVLPFDWYMLLYHAKHGKIGFIDRTMSVYRRHQDGLWWSRGDRREFWERFGLKHIEFYRELLKLYDDKKSEKIIMSSIFEIFNTMVDIDLKYSTSLVKDVVDAYPDLCKQFFYEQRRQPQRLETKIKHLQKQNLELKKENNRVSQELANVYNSKGWRVLSRFYRAKAKIKKI